MSIEETDAGNLPLDLDEIRSCLAPLGARNDANADVTNAEVWALIAAVEARDAEIDRRRQSTGLLVAEMAECIRHGGPSNWLEFVSPEMRETYLACVVDAARADRSLL